MFVGGYPMAQEVKNGPFTSKNSALLRSVLSKMQRERPKAEQIIPDFTYACLCSPEYDEKAKKFKICAEDVKHCSLHLLQRIDRIKPKVIVAMGAQALLALGIKGTSRQLRGGIYFFTRDDEEKVPVIATFHTVEVAKSPGLIKTFQKDIGKAFTLAKGSFADCTMSIQTPTAFEDVCTELDTVLSTAEKAYAETGKPLGIAVDTEDTSLNPYVATDRMIAISMSYKDSQGLAYPVEHAKCPYTVEQVKTILDKTSAILSSKATSIIMANAKFDIQWLHYHYGIPLRSIAYDVMLAEHVLDEDKKGEYSLKDVTRDRFPAMGKYEEELKAHLASVWKEKDDAVAKLREDHKVAMSAARLSWWVSLDKEERIKISSNWVAAGYIALSDVQDLIEVTRRKYKGDLVIPKKYQTSVNKLISQVPEDSVPEEVKIPELMVPEDLLSKSYEDADLNILLTYAAIDALTTRMICKDQQKDFAEDNLRIQRVEKSLGRSIPTVPCYTVMRNNTLPLCECIANMEYNGVRLDRERAQEYRRIITEKISEAEDVMFTEVGWKFNTSSSSPDLAKILFKDMKLPIKKTTDSGAPSTDAEVIKELSDEYKLPFLEKVLVFRKLDKCLHTYIDNWLKMSAYDGKIHAQFNQIGTATYRLSSSNPWNVLRTGVVKRREFGGSPDRIIPSQAGHYTNTSPEGVTTISKESTLKWVEARRRGADLRTLDDIVYSG